MFDVGFGLLRPVRRAANDFATGEGEQLLSAQIGQILGTRSSTPRAHGELRWRPNFGSKLHLLRHQSINEGMRALARAWVTEALGLWLPRVEVTSVDVSDRDRVLTVRVAYRVRDSRGQTILDDRTVEVRP